MIESYQWAEGAVKTIGMGELVGELLRTQIRVQQKSKK
jgi:hypothetical protein